MTAWPPDPAPTPSDPRKIATALASIGNLVDRLVGPRWVLPVLCAFAVVAFYPLTHYFFSQDDFTLLHWAVYSPLESFGNFFRPVAHHFRPLTKVVYFAVGYRMWGLNPIAYHVFSLIVHVCNTLMVYYLLRELRVAVGGALVGTALFALNVAFFHVVGWITCVQQLAGCFFMLLCIILALEALRERSVLAQLLSVVSYVLAVMSLEQPALTPLVIVLIAVTGLNNGCRYSLWSTIRTVWPHLLLCAGYFAMRVWWKGLPRGGIAKFHYGKNILENGAAYSGGLFNFWPDIGNAITSRPMDLTASHIILGGLILYNLLRRRVWAVVFAVVFMAFAYLPALFMVRHYFYYHSYVPAFGAVFLLSAAIDDELVLHFGSERRRRVAAALLVVVIFIASYAKVRQSVARAEDPRTRSRASFVLKRAIIAREAYDSLMEMKDEVRGAREVHIMSGSPKQKPTGSQNGEVGWALAKGKAVRLFFDEFDFEVVWAEQPRKPDGLQSIRSRVLFYDRNGKFYSHDEVMKGTPPEATATGR